MLVPENRLPKTCENLPIGYTFYTNIRNLYLNAKGEGFLFLMGDESFISTFDKFSESSWGGQKDQALKVTKIKDTEFKVTAYNLPSDYTFANLERAFSQENLEITDKLYPVTEYSEVVKKKTISKRKKIAK